jgi:hypothetical protein
MMMACAERGPSPLLLVVVVDEDDEDPVEVATGTMLVIDAVPDCDTTDVETPELPEELVDAADPVEVVAADPPTLLLLLALPDDPDDATKGLAELPPVPVVKSIVIVPCVSCCCRFSLKSVESIEEPALIAQIQLLLLSVGSMLPPDHELQPSQRTLAVIDPSELEVNTSAAVGQCLAEVKLLLLHYRRSKA